MKIPLPRKGGIPYLSFTLSSLIVGGSIGIICDVLGSWDEYFHPERIKIATGIKPPED